MAPLSLFLTIIAIIPLPIVLLPGFALAQNLAQFSFPNETPFDISLLKSTQSVTVLPDVLMLDPNSSSYGEVYAKETIDPSSSFNSSFSVSIAPHKDANFSFIIRRDLDLSHEDVGIFDQVQLPNISNIVFALEFQWNMVDHANENDKYREPFEFVNGLLTQLDCHQPATPQLPPPGLEFNLQVSLQYSAFEIQVSEKWTDLIPGTPPVVFSITKSIQSLFTQPMYIGFIAEGGAFNVSEWNLTTAQTSNSNSRDSAMNLRTGYVVGFSLMGLVLVAVMVVGVCWCWRKRYMEKPSRVHGAATDDDAILVTNPAIAIAITDLKSAPIKQQRSVPANPVAGADSAAFQVSGTASWLKPATPR